jgi:uncharacterized protein YggE
MRHFLLGALLLGAAALPAAAEAQQAGITQSISGTRLDVNAVGEVTRVPDLAIITAGVVTRASSAGSAMQQAAQRMSRVRAALKAAGVEDRDIQTSNVSLNPDYVYEQNKTPRITGYSASNQLTVRFRDIARAGPILDALVQEGANQISGPNLTIEKPEAALDEARAKAVANGRTRAELYARALGLRLVRIVSVNESGGYYAPPPPAPVMMAERGAAANTSIEPGEQKLQVNLAMTFELQ